jgi:cyclophilin family peptidyl-prolyl cis-trans isomerase
VTRNDELRGLVVLLLLLWSTTPIAAQSRKSGASERSPSTQGVSAIVETSLGSFEIELYQNDAPLAVENFVKLTEKKFFDGTRVHRISRSQGMIQMGDDRSKDTTKVKEWGSGGRSTWGKEFEDELDPRSASYKQGYVKGVVAMANRGPNLNNSQFFIMLKDVPYMPKNYTIFGKVSGGQEVLEKIGRVEIIPLLGPEDGRPREHVLVRKVTMKRALSDKSIGQE